MTAPPRVATLELLQDGSVRYHATLGVLTTVDTIRVAVTMYRMAIRLMALAFPETNDDVINNAP